ncbi:MAG: hypothetical protein FVQ82_01575 [Planctomycetes bacterium]|nr:hypothetical protein [Planctomycetota bacterium]
MKKALLLGALLGVIIAMGIAHQGEVAYAGAKKKQVDFLNPNKISVIVCAVSNQKWTFVSKNYNSIRSRGMVQPSSVHVMFGVITGGQRINSFEVLDAETKIILTSDKGDIIVSTEGTLFKGKSFRSNSSTIQASIYGAFSDTVKSITVEGFIKAKCSDGDKEQTITVPIEKAIIKLDKGARFVKKTKIKEQKEKLSP